MHEKLDINNILLAVIFSVLGIIIPVLFHALGLGSIFLPMYIPLAIGSYMLNVRNAVIMGISTPMLSAFMTGMPPFYPPIVFMMMIQLGAFCTIISFLTHTAKKKTITSLVIAVLLDRLILTSLYYAVMPAFGINTGMYTLYEIVKGFPGIILMFAVVPLAAVKSADIMKKRSLHLFELKGSEDDEHKLHE